LFLHSLLTSCDTNLGGTNKEKCLHHPGDLDDQDDQDDQGDLDDQADLGDLGDLDDDDALRHRMPTPSPKRPETERSRNSWLQTRTSGYLFQKTTIKSNSYLFERQQVSMQL